MGEQMFDIMRGKILSLPFGSSCHNSSVFQVDNLCGFADFCFGCWIIKGEKRSASMVK
jgi:hypothetical protein